MRSLSTYLVAVLLFPSALVAQEPDLLIAPFTEEAAHEAQAAWAEYLGCEVVLENSIGMQLTLIPPGEFLMGGDQTIEEVVRLSPRGDQEWRDYLVEGFSSEHPQHTVRITQPCFIGNFEVTQSEWQTVVGTNPSDHAPTGGRFTAALVEGLDTSHFPVENVTWYDAVSYCNALSRMEGLAEYYSVDVLARDDRNLDRIFDASVSASGGDGYRLLTEAEWEYACRGGTTTPFSFGDASNGENANVKGEVPYNARRGPNLLRTTSVGSYAPNPFGLYDMHGNVAEYVEDHFDPDAYQDCQGINTNPIVKNVEGDHRILIRGSSFEFITVYSRSACRMEMEVPYRDDTGFRVTRSIAAE